MAELADSVLAKKPLVARDRLATPKLITDLVRSAIFPNRSPCSGSQSAKGHEGPEFCSRLQVSSNLPPCNLGKFAFVNSGSPNAQLVPNG